jgi:hypothetical protein
MLLVCSSFSKVVVCRLLVEIFSDHTICLLESGLGKVDKGYVNLRLKHLLTPHRLPLLLSRISKTPRTRETVRKIVHVRAMTSLGFVVEKKTRPCPPLGTISKKNHACWEAGSERYLAFINSPFFTPSLAHYFSDPVWSFVQNY